MSSVHLTTSNILLDMGNSHHTPDIRLPVARVVNGQPSPWSTWRNLSIRRRFDELMEPIRPGLQVAAMYVVGLFPIFAIIGLATALLWVAGMQASP